MHGGAAVGGRTTSHSNSGSHRHRLDIQGLRALAVGLVVLYHAGVPFLPGGFVGVDVFFVISGFLIIGLVLAEMEETGSVDLRRFWARRIRRLLPASALVLVVTALASRVLLPPLALQQVASDAAATALYLVNVRFAYTGTDYLSNSSPSPFQQYWSLATEEQFYILLPVAALLLTVLTKHHRRALGLLLVLGAIASFALCIWLTGTRQPYAFFTLPARAWELAIGGCLALGVRHLHRTRKGTATGLGVAGLLAVVGSSVLFTDDTPFPGWQAAVPVLGSAALIASGVSGTGPLQRLLSARPLQWVGDRSYSLYLWHWPLLVLPTAYSARTLSGWGRLALLAAAVALAALTYRYVENPMRRPGPRLRGLRPTYALGVALTAVGVVAGLIVNQLPALDAGRPVAVSSGIAVRTAYVPSNVEPTLLAARGDVSEASRSGCLVDFLVVESPECSFGDPDGDRTIVLFGDSHAETWFPALEEIAQGTGMRLVVLTKSSCPAADVLAWQTRLKRPFSECETWRDHALERIADLQPDAVVVVQYVRQQLVDDAADVITEGVGRTLARMPQGASVLWLSDNPSFDESVPICLSSHLSDTAACEEPREEALNTRRTELTKAAVSGAGATFVDTSRWTCPDASCPVIVGNKLMYRDGQHLTATFARSLAAPLGEVVTPGGTGR